MEINLTLPLFHFFFFLQQVEVMSIPTGIAHSDGLDLDKNNSDFDTLGYCRGYLQLSLHH